MSDETSALRSRPPFWARYQHLVEVGVLIGTLVMAGAAVLTYRELDRSPDPATWQPPATVDSTAGTTTTSEAPSTTGGPGPATTVPTGAAFLGKDVAMSSAEACRAPAVANGVAWQFDTINFLDQPIDAFSCTMLGGTFGVLHFDLAQQYRTLTAKAGFADGSSGQHAAQLEIVADGRPLLSPPEVLTTTAAVDVSVDVTGVRQLDIRLTEVHVPLGDEATSKVFFGDARLSK